MTGAATRHARRGVAHRAQGSGDRVSHAHGVPVGARVRGAGVLRFSISRGTNRSSRPRIARPESCGSCSRSPALLGLQRSFSHRGARPRHRRAARLADRAASRSTSGRRSGTCCSSAPIQAVAIPALALFYNLPVGPPLLVVAGIVLLATIGIVAVGTLFSAMAVNTRLAELLLPMLSLPFFVPILMNAAQATTRVLAGRPARRGVAVVENPHRVRHRVRRRLHDRIPLHARRMTAAPTVPRSSAAESRAPQRPIFDWLFVLAVLRVVAHLHPRHLLHADRGDAGRGAEDLLPARSRGARRVHRGQSHRADRRSSTSGCTTSAPTDSPRRAPRSDWCSSTVVLTTGPLWGHNDLGHVVGVVGHAAHAHALPLVRRRRVSRRSAARSRTPRCAPASRRCSASSARCSFRSSI